MIFLEILVALILAGAFVHFQLTKRNNNYQASLLAQHINTSEEMKRTLAMGLYLRFKSENAENTPKFSSTYIKQDPIMFEHFVAKCLKKLEVGQLGFHHHLETSEWILNIQLKRDCI
jgi:restriction system protein